MKQLIKYLFIGLFGLVLGLGLMYFLFSKNFNVITKTITKNEKSVTIEENGISSSVEKIYDSVVTVSTYQNSKPYASGTGFVYKNKDGVAYILTNAHVIKNAEEVYVSFTNGSVEKSKIIGSISWSDIAVVSVDSDKIISVAEIGSSEKTKVGDTVFTVGAPLGDSYSWSVTRGILSGKDRMVEVSTSDSLYKTNDTLMMNVIQTDAAINSGNSGGPLANSNGEVIGITSMKLAQTGVEGMGFAIPIETAIKYADKIINNEKIDVPYIGLSLISLSDAYYYREYRNIIENSKQTNGVMITFVDNNSPAKASGLQVGDIITKINDEKCSSLAYFRYHLYNSEIGNKLKITYVRDGKELTANVKLTARSA